MELSRIVQMLIVFGYLAPNDFDIDTQSDKFKAAVADFQRRYGLTVDGLAGPVTERKITQWRFCSVPDHQRTPGAPLPRWVDPTRPLPIAWWVGTARNNGMLPNITLAQLKAVYDAAWQQWARVADLKPVQATSLQMAWVQMGSGRIDGANSTLAWSYLPDGVRDRPLEQRYDTGEPWDVSLIRPANQRISLLAVATHEIGHALGLDHGGQGLMAPYYDPDKLGPQPGYDIEQMQLRYGPAVAPPVPPTPTPPPGTADITVTFANGQVVNAEFVTIRAAT